MAARIKLSKKELNVCLWMTFYYSSAKEAVNTFNFSTSSTPNYPLKIIPSNINLPEFEVVTLLLPLIHSWFNPLKSMHLNRIDTKRIN